MGRTANYWKRIGLLSLIVVVVWCFEAGAFPRNVNWRQIKTEHFTIVFPEHQRDIADYVASLTESIQQRIANAIDYQAKDRIYVIVTDWLK